MNKVRFKKFSLVILVLIVSFSFSFSVPKEVKAQALVFDSISAVWQADTNIWQKIKDSFRYAYDKGGAIAFQQTLRTALNKIAIDSATWITSGDKGQKPLFIRERVLTYFANIADEAAGEFIESFVNNWNISQSLGRGREACQSQLDQCSATCLMSTVGSLVFNEECINRCTIAYNNCLSMAEAQLQATARPVAVCQPSSLDARLRISLGLVEHTRPRAPTCTASDLVRNWSEEIARMDYRTWDDRALINRLTGIFHPSQSDIGSALILQSDLGRAQEERLFEKELEWLNMGRWLDVVGISGRIESLPGQAEMEAQIAQEGRLQTLGTYTGDAFVDAANIFINTLALQYYNRFMQSIGKTVDDVQDSLALTDDDLDPSVHYDDVSIHEKITQILQPAFSQQADYNIVADLSICPDLNNPGPTDCVIDTSFMQAISERKTVIEALRENLLRRSWLLNTDNSKNKDSAYTLRNISILRKHRILPIGWEIAAQLNENRGATLMDLISCFDPNDDYQDFSSSFDLRNTAWCQGLVDPHWVLKAPLSFCQKQGIGGQILNTQILAGQSGLPGSPDIPSRLSVTRADNYCADEMTCIKEDPSTGTCLAYGYCNEEKRIWSFDYPGCQPVYNTCSAFTDSQGAKIAYLENTLEYSVCSADNAGCLSYYLRGFYNTANNRVDWESSPVAYFNDNLATCSAPSEGCTELMRVKPVWGSNLIMGADFQYDNIGDSLVAGKINDYWPISGSGSAEIVDGQALGFSGQKILRLDNSNLYSDRNNSLLADNFPVMPGHSYTFSADVYLQSGDGARLLIGGDDNYSQASQTGVWQRLFKTVYLNPDSPQFSQLEFKLEGLGDNFVLYIKNPKLEISSWASDYSLYGSFKIYQKLIPQYLENVCYQEADSATKDYRLRDDAPSICYNFARQCNIDEVGCLMLTKQKNNFSVPAQPAISDYCPRECEGYDVYVAQASHFYNAQAESLIPYNSQICSADAVGCAEFTNLDDVASGGERREYYSSLKHCIKPDDSLCANFYTWQGDDESGYQLRVMSLEKEADHPKLTSADDTCNATTYSLDPWHPDFNPDCRQFYNQAGQISYGLMSRTITCSDNCHNYRMTDSNTDLSLSQAECVGSDKNWSDNVCVVCKNNGVWSSAHQACLYQAIPGEGKPCNANMAACREYSGSDGGQVRLVAAFNFTSSLANWTGHCGHQAELSNVSVSQNGRSLWYQHNPEIPCDTAEIGPRVDINLTDNLRQGHSYSIQLLARADNQNARVKMLFRNSEGQESEFYPDPLVIRAGEWQIYELNLPNLKHPVDSGQVLSITADNDFYIDNLVINEVSDRFYLISGTSQIPDICYYDIFDQYRGADYNLGCSRWLDDSGTAHFLRKISSLCHQSSVGCELMIDTVNSSDWRSRSICDSSDDEHCLEVKGDQFIAAIYNRDKACSSNDKACVRMGQVSGQGTNQLISDVFRKNNPDNYINSLCSEEAVGCEQWQTSLGYQYFKDPGNNACVYRQSRDLEIRDKHWFVKDVKRCDLGAGNFGNICSSDDDCASGISCVLDQNDYPCSVSYFQTIGLGGLVGRVATPNTQAGICDLAASGCTEYIDPVSQFSANLVHNPSYQGSPASGWEDNRQTIELRPNTLYLLTATQAGVRLDFPLDVRIFEDNNQFSDLVTTQLNIQSDNQKIYFHSQLNESARVIGGSSNRTIIVRPVIVDYQLKQNVSYGDCNGLVNFNQGCVLFNERSYNGASGLSQLTLDAFAGEANSPPVSCGDDNCNANQLIKVSPDRVCARWLDCRTYVDDPDTGERICYDLGECSHLNEQNECINFVSFQEEDGQAITLDHRYSNIHNITGYSLLDRYYIGEMYEVGLNTDVHYDFETTNIALSCRRDIPTAFNNFPVSSNPCSFNADILTDSLIIEPDKATTDYPAQGRGYLKVLAYYQIAPHSLNNTFELLPDQDYYIHYLLNTKEAGVNGRIMLYDFNEGEVVWQRSVSAHNGWERKIHTIDTSQINSNNLQLFLTADTNSLEERYVYFDDIHIEPVLKVGPNEYVVRDCRLYPQADSLSCSSASDNIIRHGLEGYCLERDPINNDVCLTWYPVDHISSSQLTSVVGGYQGKQPLYYCAEANANFELVEKRTANRVGAAFWVGPSSPSTHFSCGNNFNEDGYGVRATGSCCETGYSNSQIRDTLCGPDNNYLLVASFAELKQKERSWDWFLFMGGPIIGVIGNFLDSLDPSSENLYLMEFACVPKGTDGDLLIKEENYITLGKLDDNFDERCTINYYDGWGVYDGFHRYNPVEGTEEEKSIKKILAVTGWINYDDYCDDLPEKQRETCSPIDESKNFNPPIAVIDKNNPPEFEDNLKFIAHDNLDKVYQPTCNRFVQLVDPYGVNKAWASRTSVSSDPFITSLWMTRSVMDDSSFFDSSVDFKAPLLKYGQNREDAPFGAAILPENFNFYNSLPVFFRNQYSEKNNQTIFAGRPYGCEGPGCQNIGQCSLNPNVYCIYTNPDLRGGSRINSDSCAKGNYGSCTPLWQGNYDHLSSSNNSSNKSFFDFPLRTLFLKSYGGFKFDYNGKTYEAASGFSQSGEDYFSSLRKCPNDVRPYINSALSSWCTVYPEIRNVKLYQASSGEEVAINNIEPGLYYLEFNSIVDAEQQPLSQIQISWGDGNSQVLVDQNHRPDSSNPHRIYHFYSSSPPSASGIGIKIIDNWGAWGKRYP